jgi:tetratricopeptide (TPR) repeat protein
VAFRRAAALAPEGALFAPSEILALARLARWNDVEQRLSALSWSWHADPRYGVLLAIVGEGRKNLEEAEHWLRSTAEGGEGEGEGDVEPLVTRAYYYVLASKGEHARAQEYAERMARQRTRAGGSPVEWLERAGDAALRQRRLAEARALYEEGRRLAENPTAALLKLSDVAFLEGDLKTERRYREQIYGRLREP